MNLKDFETWQFEYVCSKNPALRDCENDDPVLLHWMSTINYTTVDALAFKKGFFMGLNWCREMINENFDVVT